MLFEVWKRNNFLIRSEIGIINFHNLASLIDSLCGETARSMKVQILVRVFSVKPIDQSSVFLFECSYAP